MKPAIAVLTYNQYTGNRRDEFRRTIHSLAEPGWPIYLVDNGSDDDTRQLVAAAGGIRNPGPRLTIGAGMTFAITAAVSNGADLIVFSNDDIEWKPGWADQVAAFWEAAPSDIAICSGLLEDKVWSWNEPIAAHTIGGVRVLQRPTVPGGAWTFPTRNWEHIRPIPELDNCESDVPVCRRLVEAGWRLVGADLSTHIGVEKSMWGNQSHLHGEPLDRAAWAI